jgi:hypothetical protein
MSEIGHFLLSRLLGLNTVQSDTLRILFQIASDKGLLLIDTKDLKAITNYVKDHTDEFAREYGPFQNIILDVIIRSLTVFEGEGGNVFLGEPTLFFPDLIQRPCKWLTDISYCFRFSVQCIYPVDYPPLCRCQRRSI